jgi:hypothetical protein
MAQLRLLCRADRYLSGDKGEVGTRSLVGVNGAPAYACQPWYPEYSGRFRLRRSVLVVVTLEMEGPHLVSLAHVYTNQLLWS